MEKDTWASTCANFFRDEATFHGIRYVFMPSTWRLRRFVWFVICFIATAVFIWLNASNLQKYLSHPKRVDIDVSVESSLTFPAVTICSYNQQRYTEVVKLGLYDVLFSLYEPIQASKPVKGSWYRYRPDLCVYGEDELYDILNCKTNLTEEPCSTWGRILPDFSSINCESMCGNEYTCAGIWYDRNSFTCYLASGRIKKNVTSMEKHSSACRKESYEYYERIDILDVASFLCSFDAHDCAEHLKLDDLTNDENFVVARASVEVNDYTGLRTGKGRYLQLFMTNQRPGFKTALETKHYMFENSCVEFYYRFLGKGETMVEVSFFNKYKTFEPIGNFSGSEGSWQRFYQNLPHGPGYVKLEAKRSSESITSGLIIDNFGIESCEKYKQNCLIDQNGATYEGSISVSQNGYPCVVREGAAWDMHALCRNPDNNEKPWCYVDHPNTTSFWDYCDIPRCACKIDEFLCVSQWVCIPKSMTCDGEKDCDQGEDEEAPCESKHTILCDFEDDYLCGYWSEQYSELTWKRKNPGEVFSIRGPELDWRGRKDGHFMYVDTQPVEEGSKTTLFSPPSELPHYPKGFWLKFHMRAVSEFSITGRLELYLSAEHLMYQTRVLIMDLDLTSANFSEWRQYKAYIPKMDKGMRFQFSWTYTMGLPVYSNIAIDNIQYSPSHVELPNDQVRRMFDRQSSFLCNFSNPENCQISSFSASALSTWSWAPKDVGTYAFDKHPECVSKFPPSGSFQTPYYPQRMLYGRYCLSFIKGSQGSNIRLTFLKTAFKDTGCSLDFVEIFVPSKKEVYKILCGFQPHTEDSELNIESDSIEIFARSLSGLLPFRATYEIMSNHTGHALILHDPMGVSKKLSAVLLTKNFQFDEIQCMTLGYESQNMPLSVSLHGQGANLLKVYSGIPKYVLRISIPAGSYTILIKSRFPDLSGAVAVIKEFRIERGWCPLLYDTGNVNCDFSSRDICGYLDLTPVGQLDTWSRMPADWLSSDDVGMLLNYSAALKSSAKAKASLLSPAFLTDQLSCLHLNISTKNETSLQITIYMSRDIFNQTNVDFYDIGLLGIKNQHVTVPIKMNAHRFMLTMLMNDENAVFLHSVHLSATYTDCTSVTESMEKSVPVSPGYKESMDINIEHMKDETPIYSKYADVISTLVNLTVSVPTYQPEYSSHSRRKFTEYISVQDFYEDTAHQLEDLIFSCKFDGEDCDMDKDFTRQKTNYGICYTFNSGKNNTMKSTIVPGSQNGLQLIVNTETYQNMKGLKKDDGLKIHVHDQNEIPYVRYIGKAAALSQHTYFEITRQDLYSMEKPYGTCGKKDLNYFPNDTYSRYRCNQECKTNIWQETCGCMDHYMPGEIGQKFCTLSEVAECENAIDVNQMHSCECPTSCHTTTYPSQSSASSLSSFDVSKYLLEEKKIKRIQSQLKHIVNRDYRILPELFEKFMRQLAWVARSTGYIYIIIERNSVGIETSNFNRIGRALMEFHDNTKKDIGTLMPGLKKLEERAECLRRKISIHLALTNEAIANLEYLKILIKSHSTKGSQIPWHDQKEILVLKARQILAYLQNDFHPGSCLTVEDAWVPITFGKWDNNPELASQCPGMAYNETDRNNAFNATLTILLTEGNSLPEYMAKNGLENAIHQTLDYIQKVSDPVKICYEHYLTSLDGALYKIENAWKPIPFNITQPDYSLKQEILFRLQFFFFTFLETYYIDFRMAKISAVEIVQNITDDTDDKFEEIKGVLRQLSTMFEDNILKVEINQHGPLSTFSSYMQVLSALVPLYPFMQREVQKYFTDTVRNMSIWKNPSADLNSDTLVNYDNEDSVASFWSSTVDVPGFYNMKAEGILQQKISKFYHQLEIEHREDMEQINDKMKSFFDSYDSLNDTLREMKHKLNTDENFILKNFLKLDVFYGELIHEIVTTSSAYELIDFFSDLGGYFGLLLGGSVITLIELLDLIVYNSCLQLLGNPIQRKRSNISGRDMTSTV